MNDDNPSRPASPVKCQVRQRPPWTVLQLRAAVLGVISGAADLRAAGMRWLADRELTLAEAMRRGWGIQP